MDKLKQKQKSNLKTKQVGTLIVNKMVPMDRGTKQVPKPVSKPVSKPIPKPIRKNNLVKTLSKLNIKKT
jgi:hypothetical protein